MSVRPLAGLAMVVLLAVAACSGSTSLTGGAWKLTGYTEVSLVSANVIPGAETSKYTVTFGSDGRSLSDAFLAKLGSVGSYAYEGSDLILTQSDGGTMSFTR
ncbi:MAG TPA: hypothetical protein VJZ72_11375 [Candidatus Limnocylindrales bacterium]|nr:hypothetical protein [Candidatus Limnocylindrales bacterium]